MLADITIDLNQTTGLGAILALSVLVATLTCPGKERSFWNKLNTVVRFPIWLVFMALTLVMFVLGIIPTFAYHAKRELAFLFSVMLGIGTLVFMTFGSPFQLEPSLKVDHPIWVIYGMAAIFVTCITVGELKGKYSDATKNSLDRVFYKLETVESLFAVIRSGKTVEEFGKTKIKRESGGCHDGS